MVRSVYMCVHVWARERAGPGLIAELWVIGGHRDLGEGVEGAEGPSLHERKG